VSIEEILAVCRARAPTTAELDAYRTSAGLDLEAALNSICLCVARRYSAGGMSFDDCDRVLNSLHSWSLLERDRLLPEPANQVFLAFDEGEYRHRGDGNDVDTEAKYTRPMIAELLRAIDAV
jgi:hypothetical protein